MEHHSRELYRNHECEDQIARTRSRKQWKHYVRNKWLPTATDRNCQNLRKNIFLFLFHTHALMLHFTSLCVKWLLIWNHILQIPLLGKDVIFYFSGAKTQLGPRQPHFLEAARSRTIRHTHTHPVGLLWRSYQPVAEASTHKTQKKHKKKYPYARRDSNPRTQKWVVLSLTP